MMPDRPPSFPLTEPQRKYRIPDPEQIGYRVATSADRNRSREKRSSDSAENESKSRNRVVETDRPGHSDSVRKAELDTASHNSSGGYLPRYLPQSLPHRQLNRTNAAVDPCC